MPTIICTACGKEVEVDKIGEGDLSTFVCKACSEKANLSAYKEELVGLESKSDRTESEDSRIEFLKDKIASIPKVASEEAPASEEVDKE